MSMTEAAIQGIIQGLTEFIPVSSSGHISLYQYFTGQNGQSGTAFLLLLHLGTLVAVFIAFGKDILRLALQLVELVRDMAARRGAFKNPDPDRRFIFLLAVSLMPLTASYFARNLFKAVAGDDDIILEGVCFIITALLLLTADRGKRGHKKAAQMSYRAALCIGAMQAITPLPGISRSGSTLAVAVMLGLDVNFAVTFSFLMGIPAIIAALVVESGDMLVGIPGLNLPAVLTGLVTSALFGLLAIKMVWWMAREKRLKYFGYYTLALGVAVISAGIFEAATGKALQAAVMAALK
jgi:undecaprenyl-diphosphatase